MVSIKTCLFDMGNVLVGFSHDKLCQNVAHVCSADIDQVRKTLMDDGLLWELERGEVSEDLFHDTFSRNIGCRVSRAELLHAIADIFWLNESIVPLVDELKRLGMRLVLLSNTSVTHFNFIRERFDILDRFDDFATSYEAGALKPDPAIYQMALDKAGCPPGNCFYTDDIEQYVIQARAFGINAEVYTSTSDLRSCLTALGVPLSS